ncbi:hypothetical protein M9H77_12997 [Catharanthus roseus]|uniref:Uncharacterized protein n=1 Tax=Catharanthus roseus TaxID=4058 RepID=A0ACC0BJ42_CATRO|nr:hypothetical protein M9H77_12997 [Catharanthus roseus]
MPNWSPGQDVLVASVIRRSRSWIEYSRLRIVDMRSPGFGHIHDLPITRTRLMCLDLLRLSSCTNPHINSGWSEIQKTAEVLGVEFWFESLWKDILVPRGTQIPYSAAVDLVAGLRYNQNDPIHIFFENHIG